jgi:WD40 repeat protein
LAERNGLRTFNKKPMRCAGLLIILFCTLPFLPAATAQNGKALDSLIARADSFYAINNYDSSLTYNLKALKWYKENTPDNYQILQSAGISLNAGRCYREKNDFQNAHKYFNYSLLLGRANKMNVDIEIAFVELNELHRYISANNIPFNYPSVTATEEISMFFPITKVEKISADSIRVTIQAGKYDGITDSVSRGGIISRYNGEKPERPFGLVNCYIRELHDNYSIAYSTNDSLLQVQVGDLVELKTRVPVYWRNLDITRILSRAISFSNNHKLPVFNSRYLYYYSDSLTNGEISTIMKTQLDDVVEAYAGDTATNEAYRVKGDKGIFAGENVMKAISRSSREHLKLFIGYVNEYPRSYMGNTLKFSESYAAWVIGNTPLAIIDEMPFLVDIKDRAARQKMAFNLSDDIKKNELTDKWFNEGMMMANTDNIDSAQYMAELIKDATTALNDKPNEGWSDYLSGFIEKKLGNYKIADSLFKQSLKKFRGAGNKEGEIWAISGSANLNKSRQITVSVQTGHLFPYIIAPSPNSRYLATGGNYDKFIKIWDVMLGREIASFTAHTDEIYSLQYSPNGRYLVSSSEDSTIKIWNAYDYSLIKTIKRPKPEVSVIFTPDNKHLVAGGKDSLVKFIDFNTGAITKTLKLHKNIVTGLAFLPTNTDFLFSCGLDSMIYKWDITNGEMDHWYKTKGKVLSVAVSNNGKYMMALSNDTLMRVWDLENKKFYFNARVNASKDTNTGTFASPAFSPDSKYIAYALTDDSLSVINLSILKEIYYGFSSADKYALYDVTFSKDGNYLAGRLDIGGPLRIYNFSTWDFFSNAKSMGYRDIKTYYTLPLSTQFTRNDNELVIVHDGISKIDLRNGSTSFLYFGALSFQNNYILLNNENIGLYSDTKLASLKFFDYVNIEFPPKISLPDSTEQLTRFELTADNHYAFLGGDKGTVAAYDLPANKLLFSSVYGSGDDKSFSSLRYDSIRQKLYAVGNENKIVAIDAKKGTVTGNITANKPATLEVSPKYIYVTCAKSEVYKYDAATLKLVKKIKVHASGSECYGSVMSGDYKYLVVQVADKFVTLDTKTDKVLYEKYDHDYQNGMMTISHNNRMLATGGFDCKVNLYDLPTGNKMATIYTPRTKDFMIADNEGHYLAPKNTLEAVSFNYNNTSYGFEQFDTRFNRPDLVLKKMGRADSSLIRTYNAAYKKRLRKLNISERDMGSDVHLPVVRMKDKFALKPATSLSEYDLNIECYDAKYAVQSVQVLVNNNPLFGTAGKMVDTSNRKIDMTITVPLSSGTNMIKVYCTNVKGAVSLAESIEITSDYKPAAAAKTYFIGIAVSNYKDSSMNLRFAAKDVRDLATSFGRLFKNNYEADTLIDELATKENILALRKKLMNTTVNDKIIISVNGHGLLSDSLDFYYGTYDIDFADPKTRGLKYEALEALLDGIPARKKLLLIDACHSGALDKEEIIAAQKKSIIITKDTANESSKVSGVATRGMIVKNRKAKTDVNSTYELMQDLFTDISSGNGAVIISAAGGMEYAFESSTWNNGVFTYCIRKGIEEDRADKEGGNENGNVDVEELKNYVSKKVSELTNGKQRPVSRRENIEFNWVVW